MPANTGVSRAWPAPTSYTLNSQEGVLRANRDLALHPLSDRLTIILTGVKSLSLGCFISNTTRIKGRVSVILY